MASLRAPRRALVLAALAGALGLAPGAAHAAEFAVGVTSAANPELVWIDSATPAAPRARIPVAGLQPGEVITGLDVRTLTGGLFALTSLNRMLIVDPTTGATIPVGATLDPTAFAAGTPAGLDFNPTVDRLRLVNAADENLRWNPVTFALILPADGDLAFIAGDPNAGDNPNVVAAGYDRNDTDGATATTLFALDAGQDALVRQGAIDGNAVDVPGGGSPNAGMLTTLAGLGIDITNVAALDAPRTGGVALAAVQRQGAAVSSLAAIDIAPPIANPAATVLGDVPGAPLAGLAILPGGAIRVPSGTTSAGEGSAQAVVTVERAGDSLAPTAVGFRTVDLTATGGADYTAVSGRLQFAQGARTAQIAIPLRQDAAVEGTEALALALDPPTIGAVTDRAVHLVQLADDDRPPATPPVVPPVVPRDLAPVVLVAADAPTSLAALRRSGRLRVEVACSEACTGSATLRLGSRKLGQRSLTLLQAGVAKVTVRIGRAGKRALARAARKRGRATLRLVAAVNDAAGKSGTDTARLRVARR